MYSHLVLTCSSSHVKEQTHQPVVSLKVLYLISEPDFLLCTIKPCGFKILNTPTWKKKKTFLNS